MRDASTVGIQTSKHFQPCERGIITSEAGPFGSASLVAVVVFAGWWLFRFTLRIILLEEEVVVRIFLYVEFSDALVEERLEFFDIRFLACLEGLEPPTYCLEGSCSILLSYRRISIRKIG